MRALHLALTVLLILAATAARADDWPQWRGPGRDGVWHETGVVEKFDGPELKPVWRASVSGGYSGPTVAAGRVYVTDRVTEPTEMERVLAFDARTGRPLWTHAYACDYGPVGYKTGPRASVTIHDGRAYSLGTVGHFVCLDAATGEVLWQKDSVREYEAEIPTWGLSAAPLVEKDLVIAQIGGRGACLAAFDLRTGQQRWKSLDDQPSYAAPIIIEHAGRRMLVAWTGVRIVGLDPATGELVWEQPYEQPNWVISIASPVVSGDRLFGSSFYNGSIMLRLGKSPREVERLWHRRGQNEQNTDALHALMCTPVFEGDYIYGVDSYGQFRCLDAATGDRVWEDKTATSQIRWGNLHIVRHAPTGNYWLFNDRGELLIGRLSPGGFEEIDRAKLLAPTKGQLSRRDGVTWSHPAFADRHVFNRNDEELVCASLTAE